MTMRLSKMGLAAMVACLAGGLIAGGCGDDDGGDVATRDADVGSSDSGPDEDGGSGESDAGTDAGVLDAAVGDDGGEPPPPPECNIGACEDGIARTCGDDPIVVRCADYGASCADQVDTESGDDFRWCDCGDLANGNGVCLGGSRGLVCFDGLGGLSDCGPGMLCEPREGSVFGIGCECDNVDDGVCPAASCTEDPDCDSCTPDCADRACGDNGCGGSCGECELGERCEEAACVETCTPQCDGRVCGDDTCGGSCGECSGEATCNEETGACEVEDTCEPSCDGRECGADGCEGSCGECEGDLVCNASGRCECDFFDTVTYEFDASGLDFEEDFFNVIVKLEHTDLDGSTGRTESVCLGNARGCTPTDDVTVRGCEPNAEVTVTYNVRFGSSCEFSTTLTTTSLVLPEPTIDGSTCTVLPES